MKIRTSFVTNSSSSSFIVIGNSNKEDLKDAFIDKEFKIEGCYHFGWDVTKYTSVWDRIAFAYIQAMNIDRRDWITMLEHVIMEHTGASYIINYLSLDYKDGNYSYIDHQSSSIEGENIEMFDSEESLHDFLFNSSSYIQGDNDNH